MKLMIAVAGLLLVASVYASPANVVLTDVTIVVLCGVGQSAQNNRANIEITVTARIAESATAIKAIAVKL